MQVLVLAVQNAVDYAELGVATSGATLFRSLGGSLGTAVLGAIFTARLTDELAGSPAGQLGGSVEPAAIQQLPAAAREAYTGAFTDAPSTVFLVAAVIIVLAFLLAWLIEERPLRKTVENTGVGEAFASPTSGDSLRQLLRDLPAGRPDADEGLHRARGGRRADRPPGRRRLAAGPRRARRVARPTWSRTAARSIRPWVRAQLETRFRARGGLLDGDDVTPEEP